MPAEVWHKPWVVHITPWGEGEQAVLDCLARYAFRIALTNNRLVDLDGHTVTFRYKDRDAGGTRTCRVSGDEFLRRYLQHVLPKGFHKVRYSGLWHASKRQQAQRVRHALALERRAAPMPSPVTAPPAPNEPALADRDAPAVIPPDRHRCRHCQQGRLVVVRRFAPVRSMPP